jgi:hypothetical protein
MSELRDRETRASGAPPTAALLAICATLLAAAPAEATQPRPPPPTMERDPVGDAWSGNSAMTIEEGRLEFGLLSPLRWGVTDDIELSAHPVLFFALPHVEAKIYWGLLDGDDTGGVGWGRWHVGSRHRLSYPTPMLNLISRRGTGGILPDTADVPQTIRLENDVLFTLPVRRWFVPTLSTGVTVAPRFGGGDMPIVDFPFLYTRFAAINTFATFRAGAAVEGEIVRNVVYALDVDLHVLPVIPGGYVVEQGAQLAWQPSRHFQLGAGYRVAAGHYPVGDIWQWFPYVDVRFGF